MNIFGISVLICGIAIINAQPVEENYIRNARQTTAAQQLHNNILRSRFQNFPMSQLYHTQVIDYPGSAYTGQQQQQSAYMQVQKQPQQMYMQVQPQPNWIHTQQQPNYVQSQAQPNYAQTQQQQQQQQPKYVQSHQTVNTRLDFQSNYQPDYQPAAQPEYQQVQTAPSVPIATTTTTTTTTTPVPFYINEQVDEEVPAPIPVPAVRAPVRQPTRRIRPQPVQPVQQQVTRFEPEGQDFADEELLAEQEISRIPHEETEEERLLREEQAKSAHYSFSTSIDDKINDHTIQRQETRDGLALHGSYSYSDGYFKHTIHYEADQNGYRVVKQEMEPIGDGPQYNKGGTADVTADLHNNHLSYSITADDFVREKEKTKLKTATNAARQVE